MNDLQTETRPMTEELRTVVPPATFYETNEELVVLADLPGVEKSDLTVELEKDTLVIEAYPQPAPIGAEIIQAELPEARFRRVLALAPYVDRDSIRAKLEDGVLTLQLPKLEVARTRRIEISVN